MKQICISLIICTIILSGCNTSKKASSKQMKAGKNKNKNFIDYQEDLSVLRPSYKDSLLLNNKTTEKEKDTLASAYLVPQHDITTKLNDFLDTVATREKEYDITVYTIQVYLGSDRQTATYTRNKAQRIFAGNDVKIFFEPPFYKVRIGKFTDRIAANHKLNKAHQVFKSVSLIPIRIKAVDLYAEKVSR